MRLLSYTDSARDDLVAIALHIARESGSSAVAEAFAEKLERRCEHLAALPGTHGTPRPELTPAMIRAGAYALALRIESYSWDALVSAVYSAMESARVQPSLGAWEHSEGRDDVL